MSKLLQISAGSVRDDNGGIYHLDISPKVNAILNTYEEVGNRKLIVVSAYVASVERLYEIMTKHGINCRFIHGGIGTEERKHSIMDFQNGPIQMLILQPQAMAHGITLTASSTIVWQSLVASGETYNQMNGRITRAGQTKKQYVQHLIGSKADEHVLNILKKKMDVATAILGLLSNRDL